MGSHFHRKNKPVTVLYTGYPPSFGASHPLFGYIISNPPSGYQFITPKTSNPWRAIRLVAPSISLFLSAVANGAKLDDSMEFIRTRQINLQLCIPANVRLVFIPNWPYTFGQVPWVIETEDVIDLFAPFTWHGQTSSFDVFGAPCYPALKALFESSSCKGIITHIKSTAESLPRLFNNPALSEKITYIPLGIPLPPRPARLEKRENDMICLLFTNSWHQGSQNFYLRGGLDVLEAFSILASRYSNVRLFLRTTLPPDLDEHYLKIIRDCPVEVLDHFLSRNKMQELVSGSDIFVLPSARVHSISILEAMAQGMALVVSDGWGITEYVTDGHNGLVVRGRYGKCSWVDENGMLREDYSHLFSSDPVVVRGLVDSLSELIEKKEMRERLGQNARTDVETKFSIDNWNIGLKKIFDGALQDEVKQRHKGKQIWRGTFRSHEVKNKTSFWGNILRIGYFWLWVFYHAVSFLPYVAVIKLRGMLFAWLGSIPLVGKTYHGLRKRLSKKQTQNGL